MSNNILFELDYKTVMRVAGARSQIIEEHIIGAIREKPAWLPTSIWNRILTRLLFLEIHTSADLNQKDRLRAHTLKEVGEWILDNYELDDGLMFINNLVDKLRNGIMPGGE